MKLEKYEQDNELKLMEAYKVLKELLSSAGLEEIPTFKEFKVIYEEEKAALATKH